MARFTPDRITGSPPEPDPNDDRHGPWLDPHDGLVDTLLSNLREEGRRETESKELARLNTEQEIEERAERARERAQAAEDRRSASQDRSRRRPGRRHAPVPGDAAGVPAQRHPTAAGLIVALTRTPEPAPSPANGQVQQVQQVTPAGP